MRVGNWIRSNLTRVDILKAIIPSRRVDRVMGIQLRQGFSWSQRGGGDKIRLKESSKQNSLLNEMELQEFTIPPHISHCGGCGVRLQLEDNTKLGFIEKRLLKEIVDHNKEVENEIQNGSIPVKKANQFDETEHISRYMIEKGRITDMRNSKDKMFIEINDLDFLENIDAKSQSSTNVFTRRQKNLSTRQIICQRCHSLKYQQKLIDKQQQIKPIEEEEEDDCNDNNNNEEELDEGELIQSQDPKEFLRKAFKKIKRNSTIILLVDATDLFGTLNISVIGEAISQKHKVVIAINKVDALPNESVRVSLMKHIVRKHIEQCFPSEALGMVDDIFLVSSKNGEGMQKISQYVISAKIESKQYSHSRYSKNFYVMGYANTGKSSFINALNKATRRHHERDQHDKQNKDEQMNQQDKLMVRKLLSGADNDPEAETELTTSSIPGTTVAFIKCRNNRLNIDMYDTPGIPNTHQICHYFENKNDAKTIVIDRKITPKPVTLSQSLSLFLGGLARLDLVNGLDVNMALFMSPHISIHVTKTYKANEVFIKQYNSILLPVLHPDFTQIVFKQHVIDLTFDEKGRCDQDLEVSGLGWISFSAAQVRRGNTQFLIYLPEQVECALRESVYRFEKNLFNHRITSRTIHSKLVHRQKQYNTSNATLH